MAFNNKDLKRVNALMALKHTMPIEVYTAKLMALRQEIVNGIEVNIEEEQAQQNIVETVNNIINTG